MNVALPPVNVVSLCAGIAGIDLGVALAIPRARTVCFVENEATAAARLVARMEDGTIHPAAIWSDVKSFDGTEWRGVVHILVAGYPCQPFSCAGKQLGRKDPRHLWPHVRRIIRESEPGIVFLENVDAHLKIGYREVRRDLRRQGYTVTEGVFTAQEIGAPHLRRRLFVLAVRTERGCGELRESPGRDRFTDRSDTELADAGAELANAEATNGRRGGPAVETKEKIGRRGFGSDGNLFPPGPGDLDAWRELLGRRPEIEPAFCGSSDGIPARVDQLRTLGNGVVPIVAAYAFRSLASTALARRGEQLMRAAA